MLPKAVRDRFLGHVQRSDRCWIWLGPERFLLNDHYYSPREIARDIAQDQGISVRASSRCGNPCCILEQGRDESPSARLGALRYRHLRFVSGSWFYDRRYKGRPYFRKLNTADRDEAARMRDALEEELGIPLPKRVRDLLECMKNRAQS